MSRIRHSAAALLLCLTAGQADAQTTARSPGVDYFIGDWSKVAYNNEADLPRMAQMARGYCNIPYRIARRSADTFEMYVAENQREVRLLERDGRVYIVPAQDEAGILRGARELTVRDASTFTLRYLENANHQRYGLNVFVRCGARR